MAVQVSHPGVYIQEFTPAPPIEGEPTSTVAMIGTAPRGPIRQPTHVEDWETFKARFGDVTSEQPPATLPRAGYGFFTNGGSDLYVLRQATADHSTADLHTRATGSNAAVLVLRALEEGTAGDTISARVDDASVLADVLGTPGATLPVHRADANITQAMPDRRTVPVDDNSEFQIGETVVLISTSTSTPRREGVVAGKSGTQTLLLETDVLGSATFAGGRVRSVDLAPGQLDIRVDVPANVRLEQALPHGTVVRIDSQAATPPPPPPPSDYRTVDTTSAGATASTITLMEPLRNAHSLETAAPTIASLEFDLTVWRQGAATQERFTRLSMEPENQSYWGTAVASALVTIAEPAQPPAQSDPDARPRAETVTLGGGANDDRAAALNSVFTTPNPLLALLEPLGDIDIVCVPGAERSTTQRAIITHCERMGDRFAILDAPSGSTATQAAVLTHIDAVRSERGYAALYYPRIRVTSPASGRPELWPPSGHIAGVYARTDGEGVHVAPANRTITGAIGLERQLGDPQQGPLNLAGINVLRIFPGDTTPVVWGARTTIPVRGNRYYRYVNIRRLLIFLEKTIEQNIRWAVFRPNNEELWQQLRRVIGEFLTRVWRDGALVGATPEEAFYVAINAALNPASEQVLGRLHMEIGFRPAYPAEFIVVRIGISEDGAEIQEP
jgi:phage tail sheath protein FI